ncbi:lantibiotic dehydratase [Algibacter lectus]|uniref:lantibiotic dehydratase n=1 Tax=Algibacter lectus TaxID=221126 RepID=UPI0005A6918F|nr:lantibiotic dehydratase [Algibacter lectus]
MNNKAKYNYFNTFLLRTPSSNFDQSEILKLDETVLVNYFTNNSQFSEAVYVASKSFYYQLNDSIEKDKLNDKLLFTLAKYFLRFKTRCTPLLVCFLGFP